MTASISDFSGIWALANAATINARSDHNSIAFV
jgi:hypothetical protein